MKTKCMSCGGSTKKMAKGGSVSTLSKGKSYAPAKVGGSNTKMGIYGIPNSGNTGPLTMKTGGTITSRAVKHSCRPGTVRSATGGCVAERPKFQTGGSTKTSKFAALAPPYNKATFADKIVGAKKKSKKK